jgi:PTS system mannose-specific IIA component
MIGVIVVTHGRLSEELFKTTEMILGKCENVEMLSFYPDESVEVLIQKMEYAIDKVDDGDGVIILTDLVGGNCCNIAGKFLKNKNIEVLCGVNLPMIINVINHRGTERLESLVNIAKEAGIKGIVNLKDRIKI